MRTLSTVWLKQQKSIQRHNNYSNININIKAFKIYYYLCYIIFCYTPIYKSFSLLLLLLLLLFTTVIS